MLKASLLSTVYVLLKEKLAAFVTLWVAVFRNSPILELTLSPQPRHYFITVHRFHTSTCSTRPISKIYIAPSPKTLSFHPVVAPRTQKGKEYA